MESMRQQQEQQVHSVIEGLWQNEKEKARHEAEQQRNTAEKSHPRCPNAASSDVQLFNEVAHFCVIDNLNYLFQ